MKRRKHRSAPPGPCSQGFNNHPFRQLAEHSINRRRATPHVPPRIREPPPVTDEDLFQREMGDVQPLAPDAGQQVPRMQLMSEMRPVTRPDAEVLAELSYLVAGTGQFDISDTVELIEGAAVGVDRRLVRRLRNGEFAYQSHLDLHGMIADEARVAIDRFLARAHQSGQRCVLIIHGRGLNSKDRFPVLKHRLTNWLARTAWARLVLAFTSARPCDGGTGALYVLLRRRRQAKQPIRVTQGAKW